MLLHDRPGKEPHRREVSGGYRLTTNNRMELMAAIEGLLALKGNCSVTLYADSAYLVNQMIGRVPERWVRNGWRNSDKKPVLNRDLWERLLLVAREPHKVRFVRVQGHAGNRENERCDQLAREAAERTDLPDDAGYSDI